MWTEMFYCHQNNFRKNISCSTYKCQHLVKWCTWEVIFLMVFTAVYGHFAPWSFRPQSLHPNQKSFRPIIEVTSPHTEVTSDRIPFSSLLFSSSPLPLSNIYSPSMCQIYRHNLESIYTLWFLHEKNSCWGKSSNQVIFSVFWEITTDKNSCSGK